MKGNFQFGEESSLLDLDNGVPLNSACGVSHSQLRLDDNFPWHRIRRMSRK